MARVFQQTAKANLLYFQLERQTGAIFATPQPGSPAANAGMEAFDVVTLVNGSPLEHARDFAPLISAIAPGSSVYLNTNRNGQLIMVTVTVGSIKGTPNCRIDCTKHNHKKRGTTNYH